MTQLMTISPLDGRYAGLTRPLRDIFSEYGLIRHRVVVEIEWLKFLLSDLKLSEKPVDMEAIDRISAHFSEDDARIVKEIEKQTNHDVKAVEYFIKDRLSESGMAHIREWVHFACTSDDINNISYALMLEKGRNLVVELLEELAGRMEANAASWRSVAMMSRTHGQPATPTTVGKEFVNFAWRIRQEIAHLKRQRIQAKINGATGNYNAHHFVFPDIDWMAASERFLSGHLRLEPILFTTQINPSASISFILHAMIRAAAIVMDFDRDMWGYISLGYFRQKVAPGETGSSTMPHKVNPIDFENSEGNMGLAISMMEHLAVKLLKSRFQRDLTDSTVLRSLGTVFGHMAIGLKNTMKGLSKADLDEDALNRDLDQNLELLAEPFQTAMRVFEEDNPYERLKLLTRGHKIDRQSLDDFVDSLEKVPAHVKVRMKELTPRTYTGCAQALVDRYFLRSGDEK